MSKKIYSRATSWILRILLAIIILGGIGLMMLSSLEGTSEQHRRGLEQAFSDMLKADLEIGTLEQFTVLPQMKVRAADLHGTFMKSKDEFMADSISISFGFFDVMMANRKIENFELKNFRFANSASRDIRIDYAGINKNGDPVFAANGDWNKKKFEFSIPMQKEPRNPPVYQFDKQSAFSGKYGSIDFKGVVVPSKEDNADIIKDGVLMEKQQVFASLHAIKQGDKGIKVKIDCLENIKPSGDIKSDLAALARNDFIEISSDCPK